MQERREDHREHGVQGRCTITQEDGARDMQEDGMQDIEEMDGDRTTG